MRDLTRAEAWTVEEATHEYFKTGGAWIDPKLGHDPSPEIFDVPCTEALSAVRTQAAVIRLLRSDEDKARAKAHAAAHPSSERPDDAPDDRRGKCAAGRDVRAARPFLNRRARRARAVSTIICKLTH